MTRPTTLAEALTPNDSDEANAIVRALQFYLNAKRHDPNAVECPYLERVLRRSEGLE